MEGKRVASTEADVARYLTKKLYGITDDYKVEIAANIVKVGSGYGFKSLRSNYISGSVQYVKTHKAIWHSHPGGATFSEQDIRLAMADGHTSFVARGVDASDVFSAKSYYSAIKGMEPSKAIQFKEGIISGQGGHLVERL